MKKQAAVTRREFVATAAAAATVMIVPRHAVAQSGKTPPSEKLRIAGIGFGGQGGADLQNLKDEHIFALCDVDSVYSAGSFKKWPKAKPFHDFRKMFDEIENQIDAIVIGTPDHTHAVVAMAAMERGKHVYCEKPLAHSVYEIRRLMEAAKTHNVVTQLGNQGHSFDSIRIFCEWIWDGAIGDVHTIHAGCGAVNSGGLWRGSVATGGTEIPATLDWDLWLGPAQMRPYSPEYHPKRWRGWVPFGNGTLGDWTCHVIDPVFWALDLGSPKSILAKPLDYDPKTQADVYPKGETITFEFPAKGKRGPVTLVWYSGNDPIPRPKELEKDRNAVTTGAIVYGDKGAIMYGSHGARELRIIPESKMQAYKRPARTIPRVPGGNHQRDWVDAIRNGRKAGSDFSYGGPLSEIAMLGVLAIKMAGTKLEYDAENTRFPNCPEADKHINPPYREGWKL